MSVEAKPLSSYSYAHRKCTETQEKLERWQYNNVLPLKAADATAFPT